MEGRKEVEKGKIERERRRKKYLDGIMRKFKIKGGEDNRRSKKIKKGVGRGIKRRG